MAKRRRATTARKVEIREVVRGLDVETPLRFHLNDRPDRYDVTTDPQRERVAIHRIELGREEIEEFHRPIAVLTREEAAQLGKNLLLAAWLSSDDAKNVGD